MNGKQADVVLHDGAPNVGTSWAQDSFNQAALTLCALKCACEHLRPGGTFVTKVFRSSDYNSLMWVFNQLFNKCDATKPTASRAVSAEIFVMCIGFKAVKIDPRFFEPKWVFMETVEPLVAELGSSMGNKKPAELIKDHLKVKKHRSGYEAGDDHRSCAAHEFLAAVNPAEILITHNRINLDALGSEALAAHPSTTAEVRESFLDLKVLGKGDLGALLKWRIKIVRERQRAERKDRKVAAGESASGDAKARSAKSALKQDVDDAIDAFLDEGNDAGDAEGEDSDAEEERLENELAEQVEKRRKEERRENKKQMTRQKKNEMRKKASLGGAKQLQDQPELFKSTAGTVQALEDFEAVIDPKTMDSDAEQSDEEDDQESESDSDEELSRAAQLEVDLAVDHEMRKLRSEDKFRTSMQRQKKKKKETRREKVQAAWAGEMGAFNEAIDRQAAEQHALRERGEEHSDDDDDDGDDESDQDGEFALKALRNAQRKVEAMEDGPDGDALRALAEGPPKDDSEDDSDADGGDEKEGKRKKRKSKSSSSTAIVPVDEEADEESIRGEHRAARWFSQDLFGAALDKDGGDDSSSGDEESGGEIQEIADDKLPQLPLTDKEQRKRKRKKDLERLEKAGKKPRGTNDEEDNTPLEVAPLEAPKPLVPIGPQKPTDPKELAETMALGSLLVESKKSRMELLDATYNRWTFDKQDGLPDWFTEEEDKYNKPELPISKELMDQFRAKLREINARPIRKVTEARARKKKRLQKRLEKLRSTAMSLADTPDMSEGAKARQMRKQVSKLARQDERKVTVVAMTKGGGGNRGSKEKGKVPKGAKTKVVDRRMKSDRRGMKKAEARNKSKNKALSRKASLKKQNKKGGRSGGGGGGGNRESGGKAAA